MLPRLIIPICLAALVFTGCETPYKKLDEKREAARKNASKDPTFQAFVGRLRTAVARKDREMLQSLMAPGFGYRWDSAPPGDNVFTFWDMNNLWPELNTLVQQEMVPLEDFMVAPPEFAADPQGFAGYRVGLKQVMGSWRFIYFVPPPPAEHMVPPAGPQ